MLRDECLKEHWFETLSQVSLQSNAFFLDDLDVAFMSAMTLGNSWSDSAFMSSRAILYNATIF